MSHMIDVKGLPEEHVKLIEEFVRFLKLQAGKTIKPLESDITFAEWPLGVKGALTREEIYDYL
jgi:hypothetical protein